MEEWELAKSKFKEITFEQFRDKYAASFWSGGPNVDIQKLGFEESTGSGDIIDYVYLECGEYGLSKLTLTEEQIGTTEKPYRYYICEAQGRLSEELLDWGWRVELVEKHPGTLSGQFNGISLTGVPILIDLTLDLKTRELTIKGWGWVNGTLSIET